MAFGPYSLNFRNLSLMKSLIFAMSVLVALLSGCTYVSHEDGTYTCSSFLGSDVEVGYVHPQNVKNVPNRSQLLVVNRYPNRAVEVELLILKTMPPDEFMQRSRLPLRTGRCHPVGAMGESLKVLSIRPLHDFEYMYALVMLRDRAGKITAEYEITIGPGTDGYWYREVTPRDGVKETPRTKYSTACNLL